MERFEGYQMVEDPKVVDRVVGEYLKLREQGMDRAQAKVVIPELVKGVGPLEVDRILTKHAAGEDSEKIVNPFDQRNAA